jgi:hypothetical protein
MEKIRNLKYPASEPAELSPLLQQINHALRGLRYGAIEITIHDGYIVQIERREKQRPSPADRWHIFS